MALSLIENNIVELRECNPFVPDPFRIRYLKVSAADNLSIVNTFNVRGLAAIKPAFPKITAWLKDKELNPQYKFLVIEEKYLWCIRRICIGGILTIFVFDVYTERFCETNRISLPYIDEQEYCLDYVCIGKNNNVLITLKSNNPVAQIELDIGFDIQLVQSKVFAGPYCKAMVRTINEDKLLEGLHRSKGRFTRMNLNLLFEEIVEGIAISVSSDTDDLFFELWDGYYYNHLRVEWKTHIHDSSISSFMRGDGKLYCFLPHDEQFYEFV